MITAVSTIGFKSLQYASRKCPENYRHGGYHGRYYFWTYILCLPKCFPRGSPVITAVSTIGFKSLQYVSRKCPKSYRHGGYHGWYYFWPYILCVPKCDRRVSSVITTMSMIGFKSLHYASRQYPESYRHGGYHGRYYFWPYILCVPKCDRRVSPVITAVSTIEFKSL